MKYQKILNMCLELGYTEQQAEKMAKIYEGKKVGKFELMANLMLPENQ